MPVTLPFQTRNTKVGIENLEDSGWKTCLAWPFWTQLRQWEYSHSCSFGLALCYHSSSQPKRTGKYISYLLRGGRASCVVCRDNSVTSSCCNSLLKYGRVKEQDKMFGMEQGTQKVFPGHSSSMGSIGSQNRKALLHMLSVMESAGLGWDGACYLYWHRVSNSSPDKPTRSG